MQVGVARFVVCTHVRSDRNAHIDFPAMQVAIGLFGVSARSCVRLSVESFINFDRG
jgi:hypothetical protein